MQPTCGSLENPCQSVAAGGAGQKSEGAAKRLRRADELAMKKPWDFHAGTATMDHIQSGLVSCSQLG
jgi:hypothetical protein